MSVYARDYARRRRSHERTARAIRAEYGRIEKREHSHDRVCNVVLPRARARRAKDAHGYIHVHKAGNPSRIAARAIVGSSDNGTGNEILKNSGERREREREGPSVECGTGTNRRKFSLLSSAASGNYACVYMRARVRAYVKRSLDHRPRRLTSSPAGPRWLDSPPPLAGFTREERSSISSPRRYFGERP